MTEHCGADWFLVKRILNHLFEDKKSATWRYDKNTYELPKRQILERWSQRLDSTLADGNTGDVVAYVAKDSKKPESETSARINPVGDDDFVLLIIAL